MDDLRDPDKLKRFRDEVLKTIRGTDIEQFKKDYLASVKKLNLKSVMKRGREAAIAKRAGATLDEKSASYAAVYEVHSQAMAIRKDMRQAEASVKNLETIAAANPAAAPALKSEIDRLRAAHAATAKRAQDMKRNVMAQLKGKLSEAKAKLSARVQKGGRK